MNGSKIQWWLFSPWEWTARTMLAIWVLQSSCPGSQLCQDPNCAMAQNPVSQTGSGTTTALRSGLHGVEQAGLCLHWAGHVVPARPSLCHPNMGDFVPSGCQEHPGTLQL